VDGCLACDLAAGRARLPGGRLYETATWIVEHCVGPLGLGTLVVKPKRHVLHLAELTAEEAADIGPLLHRSSRAATSFADPDQVYVALWSHAGGTPVHIHFVVQPVTHAQMAASGLSGPRLQVAMFDRDEAPDADDVESAAPRLRQLLAD